MKTLNILRLVSNDAPLSASHQIQATFLSGPGRMFRRNYISMKLETLGPTGEDLRRFETLIKYFGESETFSECNKLVITMWERHNETPGETSREGFQEKMRLLMK